MKIGIVGLGLIGGSLARTLKKKTQHTILGYDISSETLSQAAAEEAIDAAFDPAADMVSCDIVFVALHPEATIQFLLEHKERFGKNCIAADCCGVKEAIISAVELPLAQQGVRFIGCHPMAGREFSGFSYSQDNLFENASFIMTPTEKSDEDAVEQLSKLAAQMGFAKCVVASPQEHDRIIAFTSQLAHVVSSAYIKSPTLEKQSGFSAGSFKDMTRVAKLNPDMWTELFIMNKKALTDEIDHIIGALNDYRSCISSGDTQTLHTLLAEGTALKEKENALGNIRRVNK